MCHRFAFASPDRRPFRYVGKVIDDVAFPRRFLCMRPLFRGLDDEGDVLGFVPLSMSIAEGSDQLNPGVEEIEGNAEHEC